MQKTAYEMRISDWSSDVCSSDLRGFTHRFSPSAHVDAARNPPRPSFRPHRASQAGPCSSTPSSDTRHALSAVRFQRREDQRSEEHTSELQSLMRISYAVFCLKKKKVHT